ncbi:MAG: hypothetical protein SGBAC_005499 [Bacillariaceae sp.]
MHRFFTNLLLKGWLIVALLSSVNFNLASAEFESVSLTGRLAGATLEHRLNLADPAANGRDTITIRYTVPQSAWVAVGVSPDGSMVNGEVVIGKPVEQTIRKYKMTARSGSAITEFPENTLINATFAQSGGITTLTYTKILVEDGELAINAYGDNNFIAAFGSSNTFDIHQGYGSTLVTLAAPVPTIAPVTVSDPPVAPPTPDAPPTLAPVALPTPDAPPTLTPVAPPTLAPVAPPTDVIIAPTDAPVEAPAPLDTFEEVEMVGLLAEATFRYHVNRNDVKANGADTVTVEFSCPGNVWVGHGVSQFGTMVPAKGVTGFPGSGFPPVQVMLEAKATEGVTPLPDEEQTLIDPSITFANDRTTMMYTIPIHDSGVTNTAAGHIVADDVFAIKADGTSTTNFIGACGTTAGPSFHRLYGGVGVTVQDTEPTQEVGFRSVALAGKLEEADFKYRLNRNDVMAPDGVDTITIEYSCPGNVWVGVGVSEFGAMVPGKAVTGFPGSDFLPVQVKLEAKASEGVTPLPDEEQTLIDPSVTFANDRTTLRYTIPIFPSGATSPAAGHTANEALEIHADGRNNNFIGACGTTASPSFHRLYGTFGVIVEEGSITEAPTAAAPFAAPTNPPGTEVLRLAGELEGSTLSYEFTSDDPSVGGKDSITVTYTAPITGWVSVGSSETGLMVGSDAVIGIPATGEVKKYSLQSKAGDLSGVRVMPDDKQTLANANITQDNGMTTLTYTKILVEDGEIPINRVGENIFIVAHGSSNSLGFHSVSGSFSLSGKVIERDNSLWVVHGWLAAIAWGVMCPLAILAGLFRKFIPGEGRWYQIHRILQSLVIVFTIASVAVAIAALNDETPASLSANHFSVDFADGHRLIGLVILIAGIIQGANGAMRPHLPPKPEANDAEEGSTPPPQAGEKSGARKFWEVAHRLLGVGLLALTWYQIDLGIFWYNEIFNAGDSESTLNIFYGVIGVLGALIVIGVVMRVLMG